MTRFGQLEKAKREAQATCQRDEVPIAVVQTGERFETRSLARALRWAAKDKAATIVWRVFP